MVRNSPNFSSPTRIVHRFAKLFPHQNFALYGMSLLSCLYAIVTLLVCHCYLVCLSLLVTLSVCHCYPLYTYIIVMYTLLPYQYALVVIGYSVVILLISDWLKNTSEGEHVSLVMWSFSLR